MTKRSSSSQSPRDRILWLLANSGGKLARSDLRRSMAMKYSDLDPILKTLVRMDKIRISGETITLL